MNRRIVLTIAAAGIIFVYLLGLSYVFGFAAALRTPQWWITPFHTLRSAALTWLLFSHAVALVLVSLPFAGLVAWLYGRLSVRVALVMAIATWALLAAPLAIDSWRSNGALLWLAETLELVIVLPASVWILRQLPPNFRWSRP